MFNKMKRKPTIAVKVEIDMQEKEVHPRLAALLCRAENEAEYIKEHGLGGDYSQEALKYLECVWKILPRCADKCVRAKLERTIGPVLLSYSPSSLSEEEINQIKEALRNGSHNQLG